MFQDEFADWTEYKGCRYKAGEMQVDFENAVASCGGLQTVLAHKNVRTADDRRCVTEFASSRKCSRSVFIPDSFSRTISHCQAAFGCLCSMKTWNLVKSI